MSCERKAGERERNLPRDLAQVGRIVKLHVALWVLGENGIVLNRRQDDGRPWRQSRPGQLPLG